jgi:type I restriction enzyme, S subunit
MGKEKSDSWTPLTIKEIGKVVTGKTPSTKVSDYFDGDYPFITPTDMDGRKIITRTERTISEAGKAVLPSYLLPALSVCVSCIGWQMGKVVMTGKPSFTNQQINAIIPKTHIIPDFLYYSLCTRREELKALGYVGVRTPILNKSSFEKVKVLIPHVRTQRRIAAILSAYDDLIENNTRRIQILEEMARRIYEEWFVWFRFPGNENVKMVESELGLIPEGWSIKPMADVADVIDCLHSKKPLEVNDGTKILLQLFNIADGGILDLSKKFFLSDEDYKLWTSRMELKEGDCVITNVGRVGAVAQIPKGVNAALGRNMTGVRPKSGKLNNGYLIQYLLSSHKENEVQRKKDAGAIMDSLNVKGIVRLSIPIPSLELMEKFDSIASPMRHRIDLLVAQNQILRNMRDLLLPKLISGEIDVSSFPDPVSD